MLNASIAATLILVLLLVAYDIADGGSVKIRTYLGSACLLYLFFARWIFSRGKETTAHYLLIALYAGLALATLFQWGVNISAGMLTLGFIVTLSGVLLGAKKMPIALVLLCAMLIAIQGIHSSGLYTPTLIHLEQHSSFGDVFAYIIILSTFSLAIWLSMKRSEYALKRARQAEKKLKTQKEKLKLQLAQESAKLRANQLKEAKQLYSFAALGQNTAATLHELSNHLSVLGMDIEGLKDTDQLNKALGDTQESFTQITAMVKAVRRQLNTYDNQKILNPHRILRKTLEDLKPLITMGRVDLTVSADTSDTKGVRVIGDPLALTHIFSILIKNAVEACAEFPDAKVRIHSVQTKALLRFSVSDNGIGISPHIAEHLFSPVPSTKPTGLGAGLYIAKSLAKTQLHGNLRLVTNGPNPKEHYLSGATFTLEVPILKEGS